MLSRREEVARPADKSIELELILLWLGEPVRLMPGSGGYACSGATSPSTFLPIALSAAISSPCAGRQRTLDHADARPLHPSSILRKRPSCAAARSKPMTRRSSFHRRTELPFAGHQCRHRLRALATQAAKPPERLKFEEIAGAVPVEILKQGGQVVATELTAPHAGLMQDRRQDLADETVLRDIPCSGAISPWTFSPTAPSAAIRWPWCWMPAGSTAQMQAIAIRVQLFRDDLRAAAAR